METQLQHQRPTDETTLINMILRKWKPVMSLYNLYLFTYTFMRNVHCRNKGSYFEFCKKGIKV